VKPVHNTIVAENRNTQTFSNAHFRNNLFLGTDAPNQPISVFPNATSYSTYDYDGYRPNRGVTGQYVWISPEQGQLRNYEITAKNGRAYGSLAQLAAASQQETNGIEVDYDIFAKVHPPDPTRPHAVYYAGELDFRLRPQSKAVDAGARLPNVNDDFTGRAPDLGACEAGRPMPVYGPRRTIPQPFYR
jgi:hypothetical protein